MADDWRRVAAALADEQRRAVYARAVLGLDIEPGRHAARATAALTDAGLLDADGAPTDVFAELLAAQHTPHPTGVDRWVRDGRITQWPSRPADRDELLAWVVSRMPEGELDEPAVTEALGGLTGDPVTLRRTLVDAGLLTRDADGSRYRVV